MQTKITVIDAPCGKGKTSWALQYMKEHQEDRRFIFITPFLDEVERVKETCRTFVSPSDKSKSKRRDFKSLLVKGKSIVSTHSLFKGIDMETIDLIRAGGYTLVLDEVMDVVEQVQNMSECDIKDVFDLGYLEKLEDGKVVATDKAHGYQGRFYDTIQDAKMNRLIYVNGTMLIWQFPADVFRAFDEVYNLTYLFDGQIQKYYYDLQGIEYRRCAVGQAQDDSYFIQEYVPVDYDRAFRQQVQGLVTIYDGPLNTIGKGWTTFSYNWYQKNKAGGLMRKLQLDTYNFFHNIANGGAMDNMWTCFKEHQDTLKGAGYTKGFVAHNARATNKYRHKRNLAYLVNRFPRTPIISYFRHHGIEMDQDAFALSELIQWIWRSQIRDGKPVHLYMPSERMRTLFLDWLEIPEADLEEAA